VIDLHCHILPALDDGALDLADSLAMAREAERDGITVVCATPHIRDDHDIRIEELPDRIEELQRALDSNGVRVRIAQGGEVAQFAADGLSDEHLGAVCLGEGRCILLEPGPGSMADELLAVAERLLERGLHPIVAHPERHAGVDFEARLAALAARGCLIQWTAEFIASVEPSDTDGLMQRLMRAGLVHLLATDAHSSHGGRALRLGPGYARLREILPADRADWIERAPQDVLRGAPVTPPW
jgi:protein-tyrosine phosphatase